MIYKFNDKETSRWLDCVFISILVLFFIGIVYGQVTVEKTIPQAVEISDISEFVINVSGRTIDVHLKNGKSYTLARTDFMDFWLSNMTAQQRGVIKGFIKQCAALAAGVDISKVSGDFGD